MKSTTKLPPGYEALTKSEKCALRSKNNTNAARRPGRAFARRALLLNPEDRGAVQAADQLGQRLLADKCDATEAEIALVELAATATALRLIAIAESARLRAAGDHEGASEARREALKQASEVRLCLQTLGLDRRASAADADAFALMRRAIPVEANRT